MKNWLSQEMQLLCAINNISKCEEIYRYEFNQLCDTFVLGSDQVFNPGIYNYLKNFYLLNFVDK